jgi:hypothetical protein
VPQRLRFGLHFVLAVVASEDGGGGVVLRNDVKIPFSDLPVSLNTRC